VATPLLELARSNTALSDGALRHTQRLVASWQPVADFCFSDLLLLAPIVGEEGQRFVVLAHVRPTTGQTIYPSDLVGTVVHEVERPVVARAWRKGDLIGGDTTILGGTERARVQCVPVRFEDEVVAVVTRESATTSGRRTGELERHYLDVFEHFARMIADGTFPFPREVGEHEEAPRVAMADRLDPIPSHPYTSPNAISSLHRMGIHARRTDSSSATSGSIRARTRLSGCTFRHRRWSADVGARSGDPLIEEGHRAGSGSVRDVTDLRRRDRILLSKDATIREIHHRVKNNLQTIAALLRLQGRRLKSREAQEALEEAERRIRSIAIVHETLARHARRRRLADVVHPLVRVVEETVRRVVRLRFGVEGDANVPGGRAPLAVVLNESCRTVDHAFPR
jgi:two-component sensor histidine kinase